MASPIKKGLTLLRAPANSLAFAVRNRLRWQRGEPALIDEPKDRLFAYLEAAEERRCEIRHGELVARYDLADLRTRSTRADYRDNLYLLDSLDQLFAGHPAPRRRDLQVVDVGAKNWNYVFALERFWRHWNAGGGRRVGLTGYEIDGYGVYPDLRSRRDHAMAYVAQAGNPDVDYCVADFTSVARPPVDWVTIFYPFLTRYALLQWGLPLSCFQPQRLIEHALSMLAPGGSLVVFNQTGRERDVLHRMLRGLGAEVTRCQPLGSRMVHYHDRTQGRWATVAGIGAAAASDAEAREAGRQGLVADEGFVAR